MVLDILLLIAVASAFMSGYKKGIVHMVLFLAGIILGILAALKLSYLTTEFLQGFFNQPQPWIPFASLIINFSVAIWVTNLVATSITKFLKLVFANTLNKLFGGGLAAMIAFAVFSIGIWYISNLKILPEQLFAGSSTFDISISFAPIFLETITSITPFFGKLFDQLTTLFDQFSEKSIEVVE